MKETSHLRNGFLPSVGIGLLFCLVAACLIQVSITRAEPNSSLEYPVKAAFIYQFALYVEWPESTFESGESPVLVGVLGPQWMLEEVEAAVRGRSLSGRPVKVTHVVDQDFSNLHVLFVARSEEERLARRSDPVDHPVLVVTESPEWQGLGSVINFVLSDDRIRFDVDLASAEKRGLSLSSQLLNLARNIQGKP